MAPLSNPDPNEPSRLPPPLFDRNLEKAVNEGLDAFFDGLGIDLDSQQFVLVLLIVVPTFVLFVSHLVGSFTNANTKWESNTLRRMQRQAADNVKMHFDANGRVIKQDLDAAKHVEIWNRIHRATHYLTGFGLVNPAIFRHRAMLREARKTCDDRWEMIQNVLSREPPGSLLKSLTNMDALTKQLLSKEKPSDDPDAVLRTFVEECLKPKVMKRGKTLEPILSVDGVGVRFGGVLRGLVDLRDKYDIGSRRSVLALMSILLTLGPVRFMGTIPTLICVGILGAELLMETLLLLETLRLAGVPKRQTIKASAGRLALPFLLAIFAIAWRSDLPRSNSDVEEKVTFLPVPPQYQVEVVDGQEYVVPAIYGIMHANLAILILLPLPLCYGLQAKLVALCPSLAIFVPTNPVWLHRVLGYSLMTGIVLVALLWVVSMGFFCFQREDDSSCLAFNPNEGAGLDVFVLRFYIVWPLLYFFIPLMIFSRYPDASKGKKAYGNPCVGLCCKDGYFTPLNAFSRVPAFLYSNMVDICLTVIPLAGQAMAFRQRFHFPFWPIVLFGLFVKFVAKVRATLKAWMPACCARRTDLEITDHGVEFIDRCWWEIAYSMHAIAFSVSLFWALLLRFEVFFGALATWGFYFADRFYGVYVSCRSITPLIVNTGRNTADSSGVKHAVAATSHASGGTSSYVVSSQKKDDDSPTHVRLVMAKPPGFRHKAGQWAHLAFSNGGTYWALHMMPFRLALPQQQWHAFSIASTEDDEHLEFHIAVHGARTLENISEVRVTSLGDNFVKIGRIDNLFDWFCPHRVPVLGKVPNLPNPTSRCGKLRQWLLGCRYSAKAQGAYLSLTPKNKGGALRILKPQAQFTGKLWNSVRAMTDQLTTSGAKDFVESVSIMGPYGTMPYTVDKHDAVMLIGAGVGFPSIGAMLRKILHDNLEKSDEDKKAVCFIWTATKLEQLLLCFPSLLADLARYVHKSSIQSLQSWLTIKIFVSSFESGDFLNINVAKELFPEGGSTHSALSQVRSWLLGAGPAGGHDSDGTYIAQGSLGGSFAGIIRNSLFIDRQVVKKDRSLGICFCGPPDLCSWLRNDIANTVFPVKVEFTSECAA